jgi:hypothetical protein
MNLITTYRAFRQRLTWALLLCSATTGVFALQNTQADLVWEQVRPGLLYAQQDIAIEGSEALHRLHWLRLDLAQSDLHLALTPQSCAGLRMPALDRSPIVASLNASFFTKEFFTRGHTVASGATWLGTQRVLESPLLACDANRQCQVLHQAPPMPADHWRDAAGGVHSLVKAGIPRTADDDSQCGAFCTTTHPRSAIGLDSGGRWMVWVAAEGRQRSVTGLPLAALARLMALQGVTEAVNFDGGGSTAMHVNSHARTGRPDNEPQARSIANAWVISTLADIDWSVICPTNPDPK